jgi:pilus assembly protein CpaE
LQLEDLVVALMGISSGGGTQPRKGKVLAFLSSRGGVGCTSLAVNLGSTLASNPQNRVVLIDLDLPMGAVDVALDVTADARLNDVALSVDRMDFQFLSRSLTKSKGGLSLLLRPRCFADVETVHSDHVQRLLKLLQIIYSHMIVDLSKGWLTTDIEAMHLADDIFLVVQPEVCSLRNAVYFLESLTQEGLANKVRVVLNRVGAYLGADNISTEKAEQVIGQPIFWQVPNDWKTVMGSWTNGIPLIQYAPKCKAQQSIAALAQELCRAPAEEDGLA